MKERRSGGEGAGPAAGAGAGAGAGPFNSGGAAYPQQVADDPSKFNGYSSVAEKSMPPGSAGVGTSPPNVHSPLAAPGGSTGAPYFIPAAALHQPAPQPQMPVGQVGAPVLLGGHGDDTVYVPMRASDLQRMSLPPYSGGAQGQTR